MSGCVLISQLSRNGRGVRRGRDRSVILHAGVCFVAYNHRMKNIQGRLALATRLRLIHPLHHRAILLFRLIILMVQFAQLLVPLKQHRYQIHLL